MAKCKSMMNKMGSSARVRERSGKTERTHWWIPTFQSQHRIIHFHYSDNLITLWVIMSYVGMFLGCSLYGATCYFLGLATIMSLTALAVFRFIKSCCPNKGTLAFIVKMKKIYSQQSLRPTLALSMTNWIFLLPLYILLILTSWNTFFHLWSSRSFKRNEGIS